MLFLMGEFEIANVRDREELMRYVCPGLTAKAPGPKDDPCVLAPSRLK